MKKLIILLGLFSQTLAAKPLILVSYYDAFGTAPFNNSQRIAEALKTRLNTDSSPVRIALCGLETKFDTAYAQTEDCLKELDEAPALIIGLGESGCDVKLEMVGRNVDRTFGPDNAGNERKNTTIISEAPDHIGFRYPLADMYCALDKKERSSMIVSNNAGSFVCNNTAFQLAYYYQDIPSGFIHLPANSCKNLVKKNSDAIQQLSKMLEKVAELEPDQISRLPTNKIRIRELREYWSRRDSCKSEFYSRAKAMDERQRFFSSPL